MNKYRDQFDWKLVYFDGFAGSGSRGAKGQQEVLIKWLNYIEARALKRSLN